MPGHVFVAWLGVGQQVLDKGTCTRSGASSPALKTAASPTSSVVSARAWSSSIAIVPARAARSSAATRTVRDLKVGVLQDLWGEPHRHLVGDDHALSVRADLREEVGEGLDRLSAGVGGLL